MITADEILAAALDFNPPAEYPEVITAVEHASPFIRVIASRGRRGGVKVLVYGCIDDPSGDGAWAVEEPRVVWLKDTDGRLAPRVIAKRAVRYLGLADAEVEIRYSNQAR